MSLRRFLSKLGSIAAGAATTFWNAVKQLVAACGLRTASSASGEQSTTMSDEHYTITDELRETIHTDLIDKGIESVAAGYVVHYDDKGALNYLTEEVKMSLSDEEMSLLPESEKELRQAVEWHVRTNYQHVEKP